MKLTQRFAIGYIQTKFKLLTVISKRRTAEKAFEAFSTPLSKVITKKDLKNTESVNTEFKKLLIKGHRWNHPQQKKALILHGFGSAAHKFEAYAKLLADKGYEVLAFDAPAHGKSDGKMTNAVEYSEMITKVIEEFGPIDSFVAHSFGGMALSLAMENIPHDKNLKFVFIAPATETVSAVDGAFSLLKLKDKVVRKEFDNIVYELSGRKSEWFSMRRAMQNIKASILWIHDEDDDVTPWADAEKVKSDNHPNIKFVLTKGLGHRKIYHDKAVKDQVISFL